MFIKDDKIALRGAEPEDALQIYTWENDRSLWRVSNTAVPYTQFQIEQFLLNNNDLFSNGQLRLMIMAEANSRPIGSIDIFNYDAINERAEIGILIEEQYRHQGFASRALRLLVDYLFSDLMLKQIACSIDELNTDSMELFQKAGFEVCGRRKQWIKTPEGFIDLIELQRINKKHI